MIPTLHIHLLGTFRLISDDIPVTSVEWPRLQSLLAYLVLHHGEPQSRTHLAYLLWPDSTEAQAHSNLRTLVGRLRQALPNADSLLHVERNRLTWKPTAAWTLDVLDFERALAQAKHASDSTAARQAFQEAVAGYHGDLLPTCYDDWILPERDRLHQAFLEALERLIVLLEHERDYPAAIRSAQQLLRHDPLHEATYCHLMRLYATSGDRAAALRTYHTCASILKRELAAEPGHATRQAYERLLRMEEPAAVPLEAVHSSLIAETQLVGRKPEWAQLQTVWHNATAGHPQLLVLLGEAGIGKTRLAEELLTWVGRQGMTTASAHCYQTESGLAYAPVSIWLRGDALRGGLSRLPAVWLTELARLVPDLLVEHPDLLSPGLLTEGWQRQRFFEALARATLSVPQPLLLLLDDLQWCDRETLEWLSYLLRFDPHARVLIVGTVRVEEMARDHPLTSCLLMLRRDGLATEIALGPLDAADTATLARQVARRALPEAVMAMLYQETEGNPLFVVETVRAGALEQRSTEHRARGEMPVPPTVQAVIAARLAQLSAGAHEVLSVAAVIGRAFTFPVLAQASGSDEDALVRGLDELWQRRIIREQGEDAYDFSHEKLREGAYAVLSTARRRLLHRRVLTALQAAGAPATQLAYQALHAGLKDLAFLYRVAAGDEAMRLFAVREALVHYEQAQQLLREHADGQKQDVDLPVSEIHQLYEQLGRAYELSNEREKARGIYHAMLTFARERHEAGRECIALTRLAMLATWDFDIPQASALFQEALGVAQGSDDEVGQAEAAWGLAQLSYYIADSQQAFPHAEQALALARKQDVKELIARSLNVLANAHELAGNWEEVAALCEEAQAMYAALGNRAMEADCLALLARGRIYAGHLRKGIEAARAAYAICTEIENTWGQVFSGLQLALGLRDIGAYSEALSFAQQNVSISRTLNFFPVFIFSHFPFGLVQGTLFAREAARETLREALLLNEGLKDSPRWRVFAEAMATSLCLSSALAEEWTEAHSSALQALAARDKRSSHAWHFTLWYETEALVRAGEVERAEQEVERFAACIGEKPRYRIAYLRAMAVLAAWRDETDQAIACLQEAAQRSQEIGWLSELWQIEATLGELYQARGSRRQAQDALARASELVQTLARSIADDQLRKTFLSAARVQRVLRHEAG